MIEDGGWKIEKGEPCGVSPRVGESVQSRADARMTIDFRRRLHSEHQYSPSAHVDTTSVHQFALACRLVHCRPKSPAIRSPPDLPLYGNLHAEAESGVWFLRVCRALACSRASKCPTRLYWSAAACSRSLSVPWRAFAASRFIRRSSSLPNWSIGRRRNGIVRRIIRERPLTLRPTGNTKHDPDPHYGLHLPLLNRFSVFVFIKIVVFTIIGRGHVNGGEFESRIMQASPTAGVSSPKGLDTPYGTGAAGFKMNFPHTGNCCV